MESLTDLAIRHKCDKGAIGHHTYTPWYEKHFIPFRDKPIKLLEIGVGGYGSPTEGGNSLRMWKEWLPLAEIHAVDIEEKSSLAEERIHIWKGDQADHAFLENLSNQAGGFDIIIDDGSHVSAHVYASFHALFPLLKTGGLYIIEDLQTAYSDHYRGSHPSHVELVKGFVDGLNYKDVATEIRGKQGIPPEPSYTDLNILSLTFYHNIVFIEKGDNSITG